MKTIKTILIITSILITNILSSAEIHEAVKNNNIEKVKSLIQANKQLINLKDEGGRTPLHWASRGVYPEIIQFLIKKGADVNAQDNNKVTPLISVASRGHKDATKLLLDNGADVNAESNEFNRPALFYAVLGGHKEVTELLLKNGAKVDINVGFGRTPLYYAVIKGHAEVARVLIKGGANKDFRMNDGLGFLHLSVISNNIEMTKTLLDLKSDVNANHKSGLTPLHLAAAYGTKALAILLINSGVELDVKAKDGATPYNYAIASNHQEIADLLLINKANNNPWDFHRINDSWLNVEKPGFEPIVFDPANVILNLYMPHGGITFSNGGENIFWTRNSASMGSKIWFMSKKDNIWLAPRIFTSEDKYSEENPFFSPDGNKLFYTSNRPYKNDSVSERHDIWYIEKSGIEWSEPKTTGLQRFFKNSELSGVSISNSGTIYFTVIKPEGDDVSVNIYNSKWINGKYQKPEKMSEPINSPYMDLFPYIAPDESYILFTSHRPNGGNLISFKDKNGSWTEPQNLNSIMPDYMISIQGISSNGQYLFFNGSKDDIVNHYWVSAKILEELNQHKL